jgi:hypothetical protein
VSDEDRGAIGHIENRRCPRWRSLLRGRRCGLATVSATAVSVSRMIDLRTDIVIPFPEATREGI